MRVVLVILSDFPWLTGEPHFNGSEMSGTVVDSRVLGIRRGVWCPEAVPAPLVLAARPILRERRNRPTIRPRERWTKVHHVDPRVGIARVDVDVDVEFATLVAGRWGMEDVSPRADVGAMSRLSSAKVFTTAIADSLVDLHQMPVPGETTCPIRRTCPIAWAPPPSIPRDASRPDPFSPSP